MESLLYTGGTGFLGINTKPVLDKYYAVTTIGITPQDMLSANLVSGIPELPEHYDVVLHAAGKAHSYPKTDAEIKSFYDVNYQGTINLCRALEKVGVPKSFVFISTMDVYGTAEGENITEEHSLAPQSHYAKSKLQAEEFLEKWAAENGVILGILRPALMTGPKIENVGGVYNICDDHHPSYSELGISISKQLCKKHGPMSIPYWFAWCLAKIGDMTGVIPIDSHRLEQLTKSNTYSNEKAKKALDWEPLDVLENFKIE